MVPILVIEHRSDTSQVSFKEKNNVDPLNLPNFGFVEVFVESLNKNYN